MTNTNTSRRPDLTLVARGFGALAHRGGRLMHLAVAETVARHPEFAGLEAAIRSGWHTERREAMGDDRIGKR